MGGKPNPGGPELGPSELAVARQGRLPGGGGPGALEVLGKESRRGEGGGGDMVPAHLQGWARGPESGPQDSGVTGEEAQPQVLCWGCRGCRGLRGLLAAPCPRVRWWEGGREEGPSAPGCLLGAQAAPLHSEPHSPIAAGGTGQMARGGRGWVPLGAVAGPVGAGGRAGPAPHRSLCLCSMRPRWSRSRMTRRTRRCTGMS